METLSLQSTDGAALSARLYAPQGQPRGAVLIGGAMGVRQGYYAPFAAWLAAQGYLTLSFDYRGSGDSRPAGRSLRGFDADLFDWARDTDTAIIALAERAGGLALIGFYSNAPRRIGHFGFFREQFRASLWPRSLDGLQGLQLHSQETRA